MTNWCLGGSVKDDGSLVSPDKSDPIPDYFYYAASFLDTIGYFNKKKRFWTAGVPPRQCDQDQDWDDRAA